MFSMFDFISRPRILPQFRASSLPINRLHCLSLSTSKSPSPSSISLAVSGNSSNEHSFAVSYLVNTFGWPQEFAASRRTRVLKFKTPEKPDRVLAFLEERGFTRTQILRIVEKRPEVLLCNPEETLLPKLGFFSSLGLSRTQVTDIVAKEPRILHTSLEKRLVPCFNLIRDLVKSDDEAVRIVKRDPNVLIRNPEVDNVQMLLEEGVPGANIVASMTIVRGYIVTPDVYRKMVEKVKKMGFDPRSLNFLLALRTMMLLSKSKSKWEDKVQVFKKYGWSNREILLAFEKWPRCLMYSKDKIEGVMDFLVNIMGIEATAVANFPCIMTYSLEKRIAPRCLVYRSMLEKGLCKRKFSVYTLCQFSEGEFLTRFIKPYENEAPELWDIYNTPYTRT